MLLCISLMMGGLLVLGLPLWGGCSAVLVFWEIGVLSPNGVFLSLLLDPVGLAFGLSMTFVSYQVYAYSLGYMAGTSGVVFFYGPLLVFVFSMWALIFVPDIFCLFLAWDGLGVSSFLLVLFYPSSSAAGGALITIISNRVGDAFFLLGLSSQLVGCNLVNSSLSSSSGSLFFIVAAFSKSAQWPLSAWLPSAIAAPTPVSSLVHSSTLVTAGVFLVVRLEGGLWGGFSVLLWVPSLTLFLSSLSACLSYDLKRVVAISTLAHLSLLFIALIIGSGVLTIVHLITHSLFKSLLFMSSGNAIIIAGHSQDIRDIGGLLRGSPVTGISVVFSLSCLGGVPFSSGYYSKDLILEALSVSLNVGGGLVGPAVLGFIAVPLGCLYSTRIWVWLVFGRGGSRVSVGLESSYSLVAPLVWLGLSCVVSGPLLFWVFPLYDSVGFSSLAPSLLWLSGLGVGLGILLESPVSLPFEGRDGHGACTMCFVRAPCHLVSMGVLEGSLAYTNHIEHGVLEFAGPRGFVNLSLYLAYLSPRYEW